MRPAQGGEYGRRISIGRSKRCRQHHGRNADVRAEASKPITGRRSRGHAGSTPTESFSRFIGSTSRQQHRRFGVVKAHRRPDRAASISISMRHGLIFLTLHSGRPMLWHNPREVEMIPNGMSNCLRVVEIRLCAFPASLNSQESRLLCARKVIG